MNFVLSHGRSFRRTFSVFSRAFLIVALLVIALPSGNASAAGIVVNTADDEDTDNAFCSLREAITAANNNADYNGCVGAGAYGTDSITFAGNYTITLDNGGGSQLPDITTNMSITGNGRNNTIIQASTCNPVVGGCTTADHRVFSIDSVTVTLEDMTIRYGNCDGSCDGGANGDVWGGGIWVRGNSAHLSLNDAKVDSNYAFHGGGIDVLNNGAVTITDSTISNNLATIEGGGFYNVNAATIIINTSTFSDNAAASDSSLNKEGGGLYNEDGDVTITDSTFSGNYVNSTDAAASSHSGGGIYHYEGTLILDDSTVSANYVGANASQSDGGGIYNEKGILVIKNGSLIDDNDSEDDGGGLYSGSQAVSMSVEGSTISNNETNGGDGGGIYISSGSLSVDDSSIEYNKAENGGGIRISTGAGAVTIKNGSSVSNNEAGNTGGGLDIFANDYDVTVDASTFASNKALYDNGGAISANPAGGGETGTLDILNGSLIGGAGQGNTAAEQGGGIAMQQGVMIVDASTISYNTADVGGGVFSNGATLTLRNGSLIDNNESTYDVGGGIFHNNSNGGSTTISYSTISNNTSYGYGGGIYAGDEESSFQAGGTLDIDHSSIFGNEAYQEGSGVATLGPVMTITYSAIYNNINYDEGDAGVGAWGPTTISNTTISGNTVVGSGGAGAAGLGVYQADVTLNNVTIANNSGGYYGGISDWEDSSGSMTINNSIIADNSGSSDDDDCRWADSPELDLNDAPSIIESIDSDCDTTNDFFRITNPGADPGLGALGDNGGPTWTMAIGAGSNALNAAVGGLRPDQRGVPSNGSGPDLGAYEYVGTTFIVTSSTPNDGAVIGYDLTTIDVTFNLDAYTGGGSDDVIDTGNYHLLQKGDNDSYDTTACSDLSIPAGDDEEITINSVSYNSTSFTATLNVNGGVPLPDGQYRLFACGSSTIIDESVGNPLNNGSDEIIDFTIGASGGSSTSSAGDDDGDADSVAATVDSLPDTGFVPGGATQLASQPSELAYAATTFMLNIPKLGVELPIVGVPLVDGEWAVDWLGQQAGFLEGTAFPTNPGNTVITSHVWNASNLAGPFARLSELQHGDRFSIDAYGYSYTYEVRTNRLVSPGSTSVLAHQDYDWVTLLTCDSFHEGSGSYLYRRAVQAVLISVD
jgi:LPXTG-site transpeptidase (sortase) family protein